MRLLRTLNWKYAAGELAIVVVGILLAVQFDRMVQNRARLATLEELLDNLTADLQADSTTLTGAIDYELASMAAADSLLSWMGSSNATPAPGRLVETVNAIGSAAPDLRRGTYQAMLSTGALGTIEDPDFRNAITDYYENFPGSALRSVVEYHATYNVNPVAELIARHMDPRARFGPPEARARVPVFLTGWSALVADQELDRQLRTVSAGNFAVTPYFSEVAAAAGRLRGVIAAHRR